MIDSCKGLVTAARGIEWKHLPLMHSHLTFPAMLHTHKARITSAKNTLSCCSAEVHHTSADVVTNVTSPLAIFAMTMNTGMPANRSLKEEECSFRLGYSDGIAANGSADEKAAC
jgi:hypothetical protein